MNTRKQVLIMSALLALMLILTGVYTAWYPSRAVDAGEHFNEQTSERGAILFARNCRLCHGDVGEGGSLGARLPAAPALHRPALQGFVDSKEKLTAALSAGAEALSVSKGSAFKAGQVILIDEERMEIIRISNNTLQVERPAGHTEASGHVAQAPISILDKDALRDKVKLITNTITCGRVGTAMPAWAQTQGGPLSDEQVRQLMTLITQSRWDLVKEEVDVEDLKNSRILAPVSDDTISIRVSDVSVFTAKDAIRIGEERLRATGVPDYRDKNGKWPKDRSGIIEVQRGILGTTPLEHGPDDRIYAFPETAEPAINQSSCGQTAPPPPVPGTPELIEPFTGQTVEVIISALAFNLKEITVNSGGQVRIRLDNRDATVDHNIAFYKSATDTTLASPGSRGITFTGPKAGDTAARIDDTAFDIPAAGSYFFRCDVHPTIMTGTFTVR